MNRRVNRDLIDQWIEDNAPNGISELSVKSKISISTIGQTRRGIVPKKDRTRLKLCKAIGVNEDVLFPPAATGSGDRAS